jgi:hypothetical protein
MHTLSRRESKPEKKYAVNPRNHAYHVSGASVSQRSRKPNRAAPRQSAAALAAARRRRTLVGLLIATLLSFVLAVVVGGIALWALQLLVDAALVSFVMHLRGRARQAALVRPRKVVPTYHVRPQAPPGRQPQLPEEYEDEAFEPVPVKYASPVGAVFDQTALDDEIVLPDVEEPVAADVVFDQETPDPELAPVAADVVFDQDTYDDVVLPSEPLPDRIAAYERDLEIDIPLRDSEVEPAAASVEIGARPWEPIPVPKPLYATKPAAPPVRRRAPLTAPLLPPIESVDELDPVEDLEEILDRRWAVND